MSEIITDKLTGKTSAGDVTITSGSVTYKMQDGLAKCFLNFDQSDNGVDGSLNVSSVTDNGVSDITNNFTNSFNNDHYSTCGFSGFDSGGQNTWISGHQSLPIGTWKQSGLLRAQASYANATRNADINDFNLIHFGDLA
jgi:hypothetical protein